jgi:uncharacterized protein (TIGR01777 family)
MRVIITGGTGLIGRALTSALVTEGHEVIVLSRAPERAVALPAGVRIERWDGRTADGWGGLADAIVNLAGESIGARWTEAKKRRILESRLDAGRAVVQAVEAAAQKPKVVIQASGVGYYGFQGGTKLDEEQAPGDDFLARVGVQWEASTAPVEDMGVRRAVIRTGVVLSPSGGTLARMVMPFRMFVGGPLGTGRQWFSWIHIEDEVAAIRFLLEKETASGVFNLVAPIGVNNMQFSMALGRVLKRPASIRTPAFPLRLLFGEMATLLLEGQRAVPLHLGQLGFKFRFPEVEGALRDLLG